MGLFNKNKGNSRSKTERNEIDNKELKEILGNTALSTLRQGVDYNDLSGITVEFGYLFEIEGRGTEALLKVMTDMGTAYFAAQKGSLMRIDITEDIFALTAEKFLEMHG